MIHRPQGAPEDGTGDAANQFFNGGEKGITSRCLRSRHVQGAVATGNFEMVFAIVGAKPEDGFGGMIGSIFQMAAAFFAERRRQWCSEAGRARSLPKPGAP